LISIRTEYLSNNTLYNRIIRYLLSNESIFRILYESILYSLYIPERKNDCAAWGESYVIQHLKVGCTVHRSYFLASPGGSCCPIFVSAYDNPRARARTCSHVLKCVIDRLNSYFPREQRPTMKFSMIL